MAAPSRLVRLLTRVSNRAAGDGRARTNAAAGVRAGTARHSDRSEAAAAIDGAAGSPDS